MSGFKAAKAKFPVSEDYCEHIVSLPIFAEISKEMVDRVCDNLL